MLTAAICLLLSKTDAYALAWKPKKNDTVVYEYFLQDKQVSVEAAVEYKVLEVKGDGSYSLRSRSLGALVRQGGAETRDERSNERTARFDSRGRLVALGDKPQADQIRQALLTRFVAPESPVEVGATWKVEHKLNPAPETATEYTLAAVAGGVAVVSFKSTEKGGARPQSAQGTWWIEVATGQPTKLEATATNFLGQDTGETTLRLVRRAG